MTHYVNSGEAPHQEELGPSMSYKKVLEECFKALPQENLDNLELHLENGTTIFCGEGADDFFVSEDGDF